MHLLKSWRWVTTTFTELFGQVVPVALCVWIVVFRAYGSCFTFLTSLTHVWLLPQFLLFEGVCNLFNKLALMVAKTSPMSKGLFQKLSCDLVALLAGVGEHIGTPNLSTHA